MAAAVLFCALMLIVVGAPTAFSEAAELTEHIYVSPNGRVDATGGVDDPLPSLDAARERLRQIPGDHTVTVWMYGGVYPVGQPIEFNALDRDNVIYRSLPGQEAVLDAGVTVGGFAETEIDGVTVWAALAPQLLRADNVLALYDQAGALPLARYPSTGYLMVKDAQVADALGKLRYGDEDELSNVNNFIAFYTGSDLTLNPASFYDMNRALVRIPRLWKDETAYLGGYDPETGRLTLSRPTSLTVWPDDLYYFENVREGLKTPGSWYFDSASGVLYVVPKPEWDIESLTLSAGVSERIMTLDGMSGITFSGLAFTHTGWSVPDEVDFPQAAYDVNAAVYVTDCQYVAFERCAFRDLGGTALKLYQGVTDSSVQRCIFERVGANAIFAHGINKSADPRRDERITIIDNEIHHYGVNYRNAVGILLVHTADSVISHNTIHDGAYTAVSVGWVWGDGYNATQNIYVVDNSIYNIGTGQLSDMGGIYLLGRQPGTLLLGNVIHDVHYADNDGYGGWGIYLDEGSAEITIAQNLVYNCASQGLFIHKGQGNVALSNIFADNKRGQVAVSKKQELAGVRLDGNILYGVGKNLFADTPVGLIEAGANLYWDPNSREALRVLLKQHGFIDGATVVNPKLRDTSKGDYTPADDSPAFDAGFVPYDWSDAGARP